MTAAIHYFERTSTRVIATDTNYVNVLTVTAAELSGAGFVNGDKALIEVWAMLANAGTSRTQARIEYNNADISNSALPIDLDFGAAGIERCFSWFRVIDLATLADIELLIASTSTTDGYCERSEIKVTRMADYGVENTDWYYDEDLTPGADTLDVWTPRATVTFTPDEVTDWIVLGTNQVDPTSTDRRSAVRMTNGGTSFFGTGSIAGSTFDGIEFEPEAANEDPVFAYWGRIDSLSIASHTIQIETSVTGGASPTMAHQESKILVFKVNKWKDLYTVIAGAPVNIPTATDTQLTTLTSTVSTNQDAILRAFFVLVADTGDDSVFEWIRQGGSTVIPPVIDSAVGLAVQRSYDQFDQVASMYLTDLALTAGAQDLDQFGAHSDDSTLAANLARFMIHGMELNIVVPPDPPENVTATTQDCQCILIEWDASDGATGYRVERSPDGSTDWTEVEDTASTSYEDCGLVCNTEYFYRVIAYNDGGDSDPSEVVSDTTDLPPAPVGPSATTQSCSSILVEWDDIDCETGYRIERSLDEMDWTTAGSVSANDTDFLDTGLDCNTEYFYRVISLCSGADGGTSTTVSDTTDLPPGPSSPNASQDGSIIVVTWANQACATGYRIERSLDGISGWVTIGTEGAGETSQDDPDVVCDVEYFYRIISLCEDEDGGTSNVVSAEIPCPSPGHDVDNPTPGDYWFSTVGCEQAHFCIDALSWTETRPFGAVQTIEGGVPVVTTATPGLRDYQWNVAVRTEEDLVALESMLAEPLFFAQFAGHHPDQWNAPVSESYQVVKVGRVRVATFATVGVEAQPTGDPAEMV